MTLSDIVTLTRYLIKDLAVSITDIFTYANSSVFTLTESNATAVTAVYINDVEITSTFSYDSTNNTVTISDSMTSGDIVKITCTCYQNYSDTELKSYIRHAIVLLSIYKYGTFEIDDDDETLYPDTTEDEKNLIALIASILINPDNKSYELPDVKVRVPNDIPMIDRIRQVIATGKHDIHGLFITE